MAQGLFTWGLICVKNYTMVVFFLSFAFLGPHLQHLEVPRGSKLGVELELLPPAHTAATAMPDPSCACDLHHSSRQHRILNILNPLSKARGSNLHPHGYQSGLLTTEP